MGDIAKDLIMALEELVSIVRIHQEKTGNNFAWAELDAASEALTAASALKQRKLNPVQCKLIDPSLSEEQHALLSGGSFVEMPLGGLAERLASVLTGRAASMKGARLAVQDVGEDGSRGQEQQRRPDRRADPQRGQVPLAERPFQPPAQGEVLLEIRDGLPSPELVHAAALP